MPLLLSLYRSTASYLLRSMVTGRKMFPLVLMLEPTHRCNLRCAARARIREYRHTLDKGISWPATSIRTAPRGAVPPVTRAPAAPDPRDRSARPGAVPGRACLQPVGHVLDRGSHERVVGVLLVGVLLMVALVATRRKLRPSRASAEAATARRGPAGPLRGVAAGPSGCVPDCGRPPGNSATGEEAIPEGSAS